ncbi:MAG: HAD family hydrolase [Sarcina sp.]
MADNNMKKKAIIFDLDGVIFDTERLYLEVWQEVFKEYGYNLKKELYCTCMGKGREKVKEIYKESFGTSLPIEEMYKIKDERLDRRIETDETLLKKGVKETLTYLKENGYKIALATSAKRDRVERDLKRFKIKEFFDFIVTAEEVKNSKPSPEIYLKAMEGINVKAEDTIIVEDSEAGVQGGISSKAQVIHIKDLIDLNYEGVESIKDITKLIDILDTNA